MTYWKEGRTLTCWGQLCLFSAERVGEDDLRSPGKVSGCLGSFWPIPIHSSFHRAVPLSSHRAEFRLQLPCGWGLTQGHQVQPADREQNIGGSVGILFLLWICSFSGRWCPLHQFSAIQCQDLRGQDILLTRDKVYSTVGSKGLKPWSLTCPFVIYEMQSQPFHLVAYFKSEDGAIRAMDGPLCSWITR